MVASVADNATCGRDTIGYVAMNGATVRGTTLPTGSERHCRPCHSPLHRPSTVIRSLAKWSDPTWHVHSQCARSLFVTDNGSLWRYTRSAYASRFARAIDPRPSRPCFASQRSIESGFQARFLRLLCAGYRMPWSPGSTRPVSVSRLAASFESVTFELKHAREPSDGRAAMVRQWLWPRDVHRYPTDVLQCVTQSTTSTRRSPTVELATTSQDAIAASARTLGETCCCTTPRIDLRRSRTLFPQSHINVGQCSAL